MVELLYRAPGGRRVKLRRKTVLPRRSKVSQRHLEVHEFVALGIVDSGGEEARALGGILQVTDIEEEETLLRSVGCNVAGGKGSLFEFVEVLLREAAVDFVSARQGDGKLILGTRAGSAYGGEDAAQIVERIGIGLGAVAGDELETGRCRGQRFDRRRW